MSGGRHSALEFWSIFVLLSVASIALTLSFLWPFHGSPWSSFYQELLAFSGLIPLLVLCLWGGKLKLTVTILALTVVSLIPVAQYYFLGLLSYSGDAWLAFFYVHAFTLAVVIGGNAHNMKAGAAGLILWLTGVVLVAGCLSAIIAVRQWLQLADSNYEIKYFGQRPFGNIGQPNHLAVLLCLAMVSLVYWYERYLISRLPGAVIAFLLLGGIVVTQSRTSWVVAVVFVGVWWWRSHIYTFRLSRKSLYLWVLLFFFLVITFPSLNDLSGLSGVSFDERVSSMGRLDIWAWSARIIANEPIVGHGWLQTPVVQLSFMDEFPLHGILNYSHNIILDILIWNGPWIGGTLIVLGLLWLFSIRKLRGGLEEDVALLFLAVVMVHAALEYPHAYLYFVVPVGVMFGVVDAEIQKAREVCLPPWLSSTLVIGIIVVTIAVLREYQYFQKNEYNQRISDAKVIGFEQQDIPGGAIILTQLDALQNFRRIDPVEGMTVEQLNAMHHVVHRYPYLANLYRYALALCLNRRFDEAVTQLEYLRSIHGNDSYFLALDQIERDVREITGTSLIMENHLKPGGGNGTQ